MSGDVTLVKQPVNKPTFVSVAHVICGYKVVLPSIVVLACRHEAFHHRSAIFFRRADESCGAFMRHAI